MHIYAEVQQHVPWLWLGLRFALLLLLASCGLAWSERFRRFAVVGPLVALSLLLAFVGHGTAMALGAMDAAGSGLASISAGIAEGAAAGVLLGIPTLVSCLVIAVVSMGDVRSVPDERPEWQAVGGYVLGGLAIAALAGMLGWITGFSLALVGVVAVLVALLWAVQAAAVKDAGASPLFPVAVVAAWFTVLGLYDVDWFSAMATQGGGMVGPITTSDPWLGRLAVFGLGLAAAAVNGRGRALLAAPFLLAALAVGSPHNVLVLVSTPIEQPDDVDLPQ